MTAEIILLRGHKITNSAERLIYDELILQSFISKQYKRAVKSIVILKILICISKLTEECRIELLEFITNHKNQ